MVDDADLLRLRFGTAEPRPVARRLVAGPLSMDLVDGGLRGIAIGGVEVVRAIAFVVRDRDWGTYAPAIENLAILETDSGFDVGYDATCEGADGARLSCRVSIEGRADGLVFVVTARPDRDFETNRCGFCILHPIAGVAGRPVRVEHVDGSRVEARAPDLIEPWQPFKAMRAITVDHGAGLVVECRMEGDIFEMEDQRAWSDASFKTYVRPLALPWPYHLRAGEPLRQRVTLTMRGRAAKAAPRPRDATALTVRLGPGQGRMPGFGVVVTPSEAGAVLTQRARLAALAPQSLLLHIDPVAGHGPAAVAALARVAALHPGETVAELVVPGVGDPADELAALARLVRDAGLRLDAIIVSPSVDRGSTPPGSVWPACPPLEAVFAAARRAFPGLAIGGGSLAYFTELNRKRPPFALLDVVSHATCPIVHAADDLSVMQSLEALPFITRSVRAFAGAMPYRIGPSTIGMRQNPYGSRTFDNPGGLRLTMTHADPRQHGLFAAAWMIGYAARTAEAGLACFTGGALTGAFGLAPTDVDGEATGRVNPAFHAARGLAALAGRPRLVCETGDPSRVLGIAARDAKGTIDLWLANLTDDVQAVEVPPLPAWRAGVLDETSAKAAGDGLFPALHALASPTLRLGPYGIAHLQGHHDP